MSNQQETTVQNIEETTLWTDISEVYETTSNEIEHIQESAHVQTETQQNAEQLKQDIDRESFYNYMNNKWTPIESQSQEIQELTQQILWPSKETEITTKQRKYNEIKSELIDSIKKADVNKIISSVWKLLGAFFGWFTRKMNIGKDINYTPNENDKDYLINAISITLDPEKRSHLTYLLWRIKDKKTEENLKERWINNPNQFQLFLQNCKPWQLILTNGESTWAAWHAAFSKATQIVSWSRWCHAAVISEIKEENWIITDATIIQATWKGIEEVSLKEMCWEKYKCSDLLLWTFQPPEKWDDVVNACKSYVWWKYSQLNLVADTILKDPQIKVPFYRQKRNKYCSELVFTWMKEVWLDLPDPHTTPADLLSTKSITPEYCCYCDSFS